jgi:hypothetical protein
MAVISEQLALLIESKVTGLNQIVEAAKSTDSLAVSQAKAEAASAKLIAATDKLAASESKLALAQAKAAGDADTIAAAQTKSAAAVEKANLSKATAVTASDKLTAAELQAKAATAGLTEEAGKGAGVLGAFGLGGQSVTSALSALGPAAAVAGAALEFKLVESGVHRLLSLSEEVEKLQAIMGGTTQEVSLFIGQMKVLGIDPDTAAKAFQRLGASIGDGTSKLGKYGVETARFKDGTLDLIGTVDNLRKVYNDSADAGTRDAIAKQLGLRQATALIPLLKLTDAQIKSINASTKASGNLVSDQDIVNAKAMKIEVGQIKQAFDGLEIGLAKGILPDLVRAVGYVGDLAKAVEKIPHFSDILGGSLLSSTGLGSVLNTLGGAFDFLTGKMSSNAATNADVAAQAQLAAQQLTDEQAAVDKLTSSLTGEIAAEKAVRDSAQALADAKQNLTDKEEALADLLAQGPVDQKAVVSAQQAATSASNGLTRAIESEERAQQNLNKARERATALDLADAQNKIALAGDKIGSAKAAEQQAQEKLDALMGSGAASASELAAAQAEVKTRHDEVTQAIIDQGKATDNLATVQRKGTDADPAVQAAMDALVNAHDSVTAAIQHNQDALDKLHTAEAGDPDYASKIAKARIDVAKAHTSIADAQDNQVSAAINLGKATDTLNGSLATSATNLAAVYDELMRLKDAGLNVSDLLNLLPGDPLAPGSSAGDAARSQSATPSSQPPTAGSQPSGSSTSGLSLGGALSPNHPPLFTGHRASGGPLEPSGTYLISEPGTGGEILHMGSNRGWATPARQIGGGANVTIEQHFEGLTGANITRLAAEIARETAWSLNTSVLPAVHGTHA